MSRHFYQHITPELLDSYLIEGAGNRSKRYYSRLSCVLEGKHEGLTLFFRIIVKR